MGINFSVASGAGDGVGAGSDRAQQADDDIPEDHDAGPNKDPEGNDLGDCDVIILGSPTCRIARHSVTPLSTGGCDMGVGSTNGGMATDSSRISGGSKAGSPPSVQSRQAETHSFHVNGSCPDVDTVHS